MRRFAVISGCMVALACQGRGDSREKGGKPERVESPGPENPDFEGDQKPLKGDGLPLTVFDGPTVHIKADGIYVAGVRSDELVGARREHREQRELPGLKPRLVDVAVSDDSGERRELDLLVFADSRTPYPTLIDVLHTARVAGLQHPGLALRGSSAPLEFLPVGPPAVVVGEGTVAVATLELWPGHFAFAQGAGTAVVPGKLSEGEASALQAELRGFMQTHPDSRRLVVSARADLRMEELVGVLLDARALGFEQVGLLRGAANEFDVSQPHVNGVDAFYGDLQSVKDAASTSGAPIDVQGTRTIEEEEVVVQGPLARDEVERIARAHRVAVSFCTRSVPARTLEARWKVGAGGEVLESVVEGAELDAEVRACLAGAIEAWVFPKSADPEGSTQVSMTWRLGPPTQ